MPLSQQERMEKHYGFMCAAMTGLIADGCSERVAIDRSILVADLALEAYTKRWEGEGV